MNRFVVYLSLALSVMITGCASSYSNLVSGSNLGAHEYMPSVLPKIGMDGKYKEILSVCRQVATNRQVTAAQEAQLKSITGVVSGVGSGISQGMEMGSIFKNAGLGSGTMTRSVGIGLLSGAISSATSVFASGAESGASETKKVLLQCLRAADPQQEIYRVIE